jgi:hypothetical protein
MKTTRLTWQPGVACAVAERGPPRSSSNVNEKFTTQWYPVSQSLRPEISFAASDESREDPD